MNRAAHHEATKRAKEASRLRLLFVPVLALLAASWFPLFSAPPAKPDAITQVDHLVYATTDLNRGIEEIETRLGVRASPGGQHPGRGTRNALVALGPNSYLEIIGPDPEQPAPQGPRPFGIDGLKQSRLMAWAAKGADLEAISRAATAKGIRLGDIVAGSRKRPDGVLLAWRYTDPRTVVADGIAPFFIDWGTSPHPSMTAAKGATLKALRAEHPKAAQVQAQLRSLGIGLSVRPGASPGLVAVIEGPRGRIELR